MSRRTLARRGSTLIEVTFVLTIIGILVSLAVPSFRRGMEQGRADLAAANLRAIWTAQRLYWLEYRAYAADLPTLQSFGLIDPAITSAQLIYSYQIQSADTNTFTAIATRNSNGRWNGTFTIEDTGIISGVLTAPGDQEIAPGFQ